MKSPESNLKRELCRFFASGAYTGLSPLAPGSVASFAVLLVAWAALSQLSPQVELIVGLGATILITLIGIPIADAALQMKLFGEEEDPRPIVIDEFAGQLAAIVGLTHSPMAMLFAFISFRGFDVLKPPPIKTLEKLPGGKGVMLDDVLAGVYANVATRILVFYLPPEIVQSGLT